MAIRIKRGTIYSQANEYLFIRSVTRFTGWQNLDFRRYPKYYSRKRIAGLVFEIIAGESWISPAHITLKNRAGIVYQALDVLGPIQRKKMLGKMDPRDILKWKKENG